MTPGQLYIGTHRRARHGDPEDISFGIYRFQSSGSGVLSLLDLTETPQPGWLCVSPSGKSLYAVNEVHRIGSVEGGAISAFARDIASGALTPLNHRRLPAMPCHCAVDPENRFLFVSTFSGGTVHVFELCSDGKLGQEVDFYQHTGSSIHPRRQTSAHPHAVHVDPSGRFLLVPDLGTDQIVVYRLDRQSDCLKIRLHARVAVRPGSGPRHLTFHSETQSVFLLNEIAARIDAFDFDGKTGTLAPRQSVDMLPDGFAGFRSGGDIGVHPSGRFLFATTRSRGSSSAQPQPGLDTIIWFEIEPQTARLVFRGRIGSGGEIPRSFTFDPDGTRLFVGHQASGTVVTFRLNVTTAAPEVIVDRTTTPVPVCLTFIPSPPLTSLA